MKKYILVSALAFGGVLLTSCQSKESKAEQVEEKVETSNSEMTSKELADQVEFKAVKEVYAEAPDMLKVKMKNNSTYTLNMGTDYSIAVLKNGEWTDFDMTGTAFTLMLQIVPVDEEVSFEMSLFKDIFTYDKGTYRFTKTINGGEHSFQKSVEFTIE
ncbi:immunoglobulin-like domain-containing protein [Myroides phaeus]|uniref:immunoglobulin-like domain-containing protein n=1 Tax=Myroides phaeus TaxID=702745 RepID=UPI002DBE4700|nr:immunoglobulin-like domain-containing protein [Myroides phaeus]MEC4115422.1 immunoglobulin-like domain-containing protein [Myroides phaeus]